MNACTRRRERDDAIRPAVSWLYKKYDERCKLGHLYMEQLGLDLMKRRSPFFQCSRSNCSHNFRASKSRERERDNLWSFQRMSHGFWIFWSGLASERKRIRLNGINLCSCLNTLLCVFCSFELGVDGEGRADNLARQEGNERNSLR